MGWATKAKHLPVTLLTDVMRGVLAERTPVNTAPKTRVDWFCYLREKMGA
ncbi:MAG: hypothetical protein ACK51D_08485 [Cyclobacteriaceae bacterium]